MDSSWIEKAACKGMAEMSGSYYPFFPTPNERPNQRELRIRRAKDICGQCAVRSECLDYALEGDVHNNTGVWGGYDEYELLLMVRSRKTSL